MAVHQDGNIIKIGEGQSRPFTCEATTVSIAFERSVRLILKRRDALETLDEVDELRRVDTLSAILFLLSLPVCPEPVNQGSERSELSFTDSDAL